MVLSVKLEEVNYKEPRIYDDDLDLDFIDHVGNLKISSRKKGENLMGFKSQIVYFDNTEQQIVGVKYDSYNDHMRSEPLKFSTCIKIFNRKSTKFKTIVIETIEDEPLGLIAKKATLFSLIKNITLETNAKYGYFNNRSPVERIAMYYRSFIWHIEPIFKGIVGRPLEQLFYSEEEYIMKACGIKSYRLI